MMVVGRVAGLGCQSKPQPVGPLSEGFPLPNPGNLVVDEALTRAYVEGVQKARNGEQGERVSYLHRVCVTGVWVGHDKFTTMGRGQYGGDVALPIWMDYMAPALAKYPPSEYEKPAGIRFVSVDSETGKLSREGETGVRVPFKKGTEPKEFAPTAGQVDSAEFLSGGF